ncbi:uncharacterized protein [Apostichopus japonicus]|uniref:uncharacterized protein isoform X2 n=1 Tax=Stichopus japonicus TaxID=307972 RepID=UPI003AB718BB
MRTERALLASPFSMKMVRAIFASLSITFLVLILTLLSVTNQTQSNGVVTGTRGSVNFADPRPKVAQMKEKSSGSRRQSQYDQESAGDDHRGRGEMVPSPNIGRRIENDENDFGDSDRDSTKEKTGMILRKSKTNKNKHGAAGFLALMRDKSNWVNGKINGSFGQYLLQRLNSNTAVDQSVMKGYKSKVTTDEGMIKEQSHSMSVSETREESSSDSYESNDGSEVSSGSDKEQKLVFGKENKKSQKNIPKLQSIWKITVR